MLQPGAQRLAQAASPTGRPPQGVAVVWMQPAVVTAVTPAGGADGNDLLTVTYGASAQDVAYLDSYTPAVDDTVVLLISSDGALLCLGRPIGTPP